MWYLYWHPKSISINFCFPVCSKTHRWSAGQYSPEKCFAEPPVLSCPHALWGFRAETQSCSVVVLMLTTPLSCVPDRSEDHTSAKLTTIIRGASGLRFFLSVSTNERLINVEVNGNYSIPNFHFNSMFTATLVNKLDIGQACMTGWAQSEYMQANRQYGWVFTCWMKISCRI